MSTVVEQGYKQTAIGVIPGDWSVCKLGDLAPYVTSGSRGWAEYYSDHGDPFVRITNLSRSTIYIDQANLKFVQIPDGDSEGQRTALIDGDLLISITADIGIIGYVNSSLSKPAYINQHIALVRFKDPGVDSKYLSYFLVGEVTQRLFRSSTDQGAKAGMNLAGIRSIKAVLPPIAEQRAISAALSEVDNLLTSLDKLITKKRDIQQATMQQLLTGQRRLSGFSGEWELKRLGEIGAFTKGSGITRNQLNSGGLPCVRYGEIYTTHHNLVRDFQSFISKEVAASATLLKFGDLLFAGSGETKTEIGKCVAFVNDFEAYAGGDIVILRPISSDSTFLGYALNMQEICRQKTSRGQGDAVVHISANALSTIEIKLPPKDEQTAIAAILSDMDRELTALETRRDKARQLKQGMMQELLTGRIRLIEPNPQSDEKDSGRQANVHFLRSVLAAEIIDRLHDQPTFGHVKFEKMMFLVEHLCDVDTGSTYHRKAAGPYDNRALRSIDSQLRKQKWFDAHKEKGRYQYVPMEKRGGHKQYFERHFSAIGDAFGKILATFTTAKTEQCEIVATLLAAWNDLLHEQVTVSDEMIVHEVLNNWHESKQRIPEERWHKALVWMREKGFVPRGVS